MEVDEMDLPSADECQRRSVEFAKITQTDTALAMMFLQDTAWNLEQALNLFFREMAEATAPEPPSSSSSAPTSSSASAFTVAFPTEGSEQQRVRVLSWNLDGLCSKALARRTDAAVSVIRNNAPHLVLLQEVVVDSLRQFRGALQADYHVVIQRSSADYFCAILVHRSTGKITASGSEPFDNSVMGRGLVWANVRLKAMPRDCLVMTAHLESTKDYGESRKAQLREAWDRMRAAEGNAIFAGDLNLRDREITELGGLPAALLDVWEAAGRRSIAEATWDPRRNSNAASLVGSRVPGLRFDRMYLKRAAAPGALRPVYFELIGIEKVPGDSCFVSDHWGILGHFDIE